METFVQFLNLRRRWLRGMIHRPAGKAGGGRAPGVVFLHGFTGDRMESHWLFVKCARALAVAGIASLRFDFYGSGESEGEFREATLRGEIADARSAVAFLRRQKGINAERVGLLGLSLGGAIAARIAAGAKARALVLWSALAHAGLLQTLAESATRKIPDRNGAREYGGHEIGAGFLEGLDRCNPLESIARFRRPTLIIHPEKDEFLSLEHPESFYRASGAKFKEKLIVPGADHTFTSVRWEREVIAQTADWFRAHL